MEKALSIDILFTSCLQFVLMASFLYFYVSLLRCYIKVTKQHHLCDLFEREKDL